MRHIYANRTVYLIAALLVLVSLLFAWLRSAQVILTTERTIDALFADATSLEAFDWEALGEHSYAVNCRSCHGAEGRGWGAYPGLRTLAPLFNAEGGRDYLLHVTLHGLASPRHTAPMPQFLNLPDAEVAAVNNFILTRWGNEAAVDPEELYLPSDVTPLRTPTLSPWDVNALRGELDAAGLAEVPEPVLASAGFDWQARGAALFEERCSGCHVTVPQTPALLQAAGGREYLRNLLLYGLAGELEHPAFEELSDEDAAAVLNQTVVTAPEAGDLPEDTQLFTPEELAEARETPADPEEVAVQRPALEDPEDLEDEAGE
jgi:mono/diheme cytochrome c family protein